MFDGADPAACSRYQIAYGHAATLLEASRFDHIFGRDFAVKIVPTEYAILTAVLRHMEPGRRDVVELAVHDVVVKKRKPRW
jgi:hypothetical protein